MLQKELNATRQEAEEKVGSIFMTSGCNLDCKAVLHVVAPYWNNGAGSSQQVEKVLGPPFHLIMLVSCWHGIDLWLSTKANLSWGWGTLGLLQLLLVANRYRPGMLLNLLQSIYQAPQQRIMWLRLRNLSIYLTLFIYWKLCYLPWRAYHNYHLLQSNQPLKVVTIIGILQQWCLKIILVWSIFSITKRCSQKLRYRMNKGQCPSFDDLIFTSTPSLTPNVFFQNKK